MGTTGIAGEITQSPDNLLVAVCWLILGDVIILPSCSLNAGGDNNKFSGKALVILM